MEIEIHYAQRHSKVSESAVQNGFGVVPSVPDGDRNLSRRQGCSMLIELQLKTLQNAKI